MLSIGLLLSRDEVIYADKNGENDNRFSGTTFISFHA